MRQASVCKFSQTMLTLTRQASNTTIAGDRGTVEEVEIGENGDNHFFVLWDRREQQTWHLSANKFNIIGEAE